MKQSLALPFIIAGLIGFGLVWIYIRHFADFITSITDSIVAIYFLPQVACVIIPVVVLIALNKFTWSILGECWLWILLSIVATFLPVVIWWIGASYYGGL